MTPLAGARARKVLQARRQQDLGARRWCPARSRIPREGQRTCSDLWELEGKGRNRRPPYGVGGVGRMSPGCRP